MNIRECRHTQQYMHICLSIGYLYFYLSIYTVDMHVYIDSYAFITVYLYVRIKNVHWVGLRTVLTKRPNMYSRFTRKICRFYRAD